MLSSSGFGQGGSNAPHHLLGSVQVRINEDRSGEDASLRAQIGMLRQQLLTQAVFIKVPPSCCLSVPHDESAPGGHLTPYTSNTGQSNRRVDIPLHTDPCRSCRQRGSS